METRSFTKKYSGAMVKFAPAEDYIAQKGYAFAVCDGVTLQHIEPYPNPSPAFFAAQAFGDAVVEHLSEGNLEELRTAYRAGSEAVRAYNAYIGITPETVDFLKKQYAATVGVFGLIKASTLYFGQITDCGIIVVDKNGHRQISLMDEHKPYVGFIKNMRDEGSVVAGSPEEHQFVRSKLVNDTTHKFDGYEVGFGVVTGEESAEHFLRTGAISLLPGDIVIGYSDGFLPYFEDDAFLDFLRTKPSQEELDACIVAREQDGETYCKEKSILVIYPD